MLDELCIVIVIMPRTMLKYVHLSTWFYFCNYLLGCKPYSKNLPALVHWQTIFINLKKKYNSSVFTHLHRTACRYETYCYIYTLYIYSTVIPIGCNKDQKFSLPKSQKEQSHIQSNLSMPLTTPQLL